jgi:hypothetical protein
VEGVVGVHRAYHKQKRSLASRALQGLLQDNEDDVSSFKRPLGGYKAAGREQARKAAEEQDERELVALREEFGCLVRTVRSTANLWA